MMIQVYQTDFTANKGNALQACVASILGLPLEEVPNFIEDPNGYERGINSFLEARSMGFIKLPLTTPAELKYPCSAAGLYCIVAGMSPRGSHKHCVVCQVCNDKFVFVHDPHPDGNMITTMEWAGFLVSTQPPQK